MRVYQVLAAVVLLILSAATLLHTQNTDKVPDTAVNWFKQELPAFTRRVVELKNCIGALDRPSGSIAQAKHALVECRLQYKRLAFFLEYYFPEQALGWNGPPIPEAEPGEELKDATGLQLIEQLLLGEHPSSYTKAMNDQTDMLIRSSENLIPLLHDFKTDPGDFLESMHLELIRVMTLYITGFDAPQLKSGIAEAHVAVSTMHTLTSHYIKNDSLNFYLAQAAAYLQKSSHFDSFDRLAFIVSYAQPIEKYLNKSIRGVKSATSNEAVLNDSVDNLFQPGALNKKAFPNEEYHGGEEVEALGMKLFFEAALSGNKLRSCASCHSPASFFADRLTRNKSFDGKLDLSRNTPSLFYAVYQHAQFWDGRSETLEHQVNAVLTSESEMNASEDTLINRLRNDSAYVAIFKKNWPADSLPTYKHARSAIAAFIRTLTPFRSRFDEYMNGNMLAMSPQEKRGFNLFMGKAQCGTCHFAPIFNGLLPPYYNTSEFEILGTTANETFEHPVADTDPGRFGVQPGPLTKAAFKTPTVRNAAMTAPYMHNGQFTTIEKVIEFYDKGGGNGLGLHNPDQTLSSTPLNLDSSEKQDLAAFIKALTDQ